MPQLAGLNHVAVLTRNLERFIHFYSHMFGAQVIFREDVNGLRHAILRLGPGSWLHPAERPDSPHAHADPRMFQRGHLDHLALGAVSKDAFEQIRARLIAGSASDGMIEDLGAFHSLWFEDPDGMRGELTLIVDPDLREIHAPRPLASPA